MRLKNLCVHFIVSLLRIKMNRLILKLLHFCTGCRWYRTIEFSQKIHLVRWIHFYQIGASLYTVIQRLMDVQVAVSEHVAWACSVISYETPGTPSNGIFWNYAKIKVQLYYVYLELFSLSARFEPWPGLSKILKRLKFGFYPPLWAKRSAKNVVQVKHFQNCEPGFQQKNML